MNVQTKTWARPLALFIALTMIMMYSFGGVAFANGDNDDNSPKVGVESEDRGGHDNGNGKSNSNAFGHDNEDGLPEGEGDGSTGEGTEGVSGEENSEPNGDEENVPEPEAVLLEAGLLNTNIMQLAGTVDVMVRVHYINDPKVATIVVTAVVNSITYTAEANLTTGYNYDGTFKVPDEDDFKSSIAENNVTLTIKGTDTKLSIRNISAKGNGWINITVAGEIDPKYDLSIDKTVNDNSNASVEIDQIATFVVTVVNNGPDTAKDVVVQDTWPNGLLYGPATASKGTFSTSTGIWTIGDLVSGEVVTLTIQASSSIADDYTNTVEFDFTPNYDTNAQNDKDTATLTVFDPTKPIRDLRVTKNC